MAKKYIVRDGFIVNLIATASNGEEHEKKAIGGEIIELDDSVADRHLHKLEFADKKDRDAALKAEQERKVASMATANPAQLIQQLTAALAQATAQKPATPPAE